MDLIVAVCRTLASEPRLHLLRAVQSVPDSTVRDLAASTSLSPDIASQQLKLLGRFQFVRSAPRGRYVYYQPANSRDLSNVFLRDMLTFLHQVPGMRNSTPCKVWNSDEQEKWGDELIKLFTTYTHLRRLLILRHIARDGACTPADLTEYIGMSLTATSRHLAKLRRRGVVCADGKPPCVWRLNQQVEPTLRRALFKIILRALKTD